MDRVKIGKKKLGEGGYGTVWLGTYIIDPKTGKQTEAAIKRISVDYMRIQEVELQSKLSRLPKCNVHVACLYNVIKDAKTFYIVMEYIKGTDLATFWEKNHPLSVAQILKVYRQILEGLEYIHSAGIGHGDIKLENLMMDSRHGSVKFIDFGYGCTKSTCKSNPFFHGTTILSPPESFAKRPSAKTLASIQAADVWAVGMTFVELLTTNIGRMGISGRQLARRGGRVDPKVIQTFSDVKLPLWVYDLISKMMEPIPSKRLTAAQALNILRGK